MTHAKNIYEHPCILYNVPPTEVKEMSAETWDLKEEGSTWEWGVKHSVLRILDTSGAKFNILSRFLPGDAASGSTQKGDPGPAGEHRCHYSLQSRILPILGLSIVLRRGSMLSFVTEKAPIVKEALNAYMVILHSRHTHEAKWTGCLKQQARRGSNLAGMPTSQGTCSCHIILLSSWAQLL